MDPITRLTALGSAGAGGGDSYWIATLTGIGFTSTFGLGVNSSGDVFFAGRTASSSPGNDDILIGKYDSSGTIQWQRTLAGSAYESARRMVLDSSDNIYIASWTGSAGAGADDALIAKYDSSGAIQWQRTLGGPLGSDRVYDIALDSSNNIYLVGETASNDCLISKYNSSGTIQWQRTLGGTSGDQGYAVAVDGSGNVYIGGRSYASGTGDDALIAKYNSSGAIQWQRTLGGSNTDAVQGMTVDSSGNIYIAGYTNSAGAGVLDALIVKYNSSGVIQWQRTLGSANSDYGYSVTLDSLGNLYIAGRAGNVGAGGYDALIAKYDSSGIIQWQRILGGSSNDLLLSIAVDGSGNIYAAGNTYTGTNYDSLIVKLPGDGSLTGTYGVFTYASSSLTDSASSLTDAASSLTDSTSSLTDAASSLTDAASSLTSSLTTL